MCAVNAGESSFFGLHIAGRTEPADSRETFTSTDPATEMPIAQVASAGEADVARAVESAHAAFPAWSGTSPVERGRLLAAIGRAIREHREELGALETADNGKPLTQALWDVDISARFFEYYAGFADKLGGETIPLGPGYVSYTRREPFGVIAEILPWNAPIHQAARGIAPALVVGNTVVAKPAVLTSLTTVRLAELASEQGLPPGVLNVVTGSGSVVGERLIAHPLIRKVAFTGSVETGRAIARAAADRLIPAILELGGKSANIVFADADVARAAEGAFKAFTFNAGQICSAGTRLLVHEDVHDALVERLVALASSVTIGPGCKDMALGALTSRAQQQTVEHYIELARAEGARVLAPAQMPSASDGFFAAPVILDNVKNEMRVAREEIFGPVLCVIRFSSDEEAVAIANDSPFGLVAGLWTKNLSRAHRIAAELDVGQVYVNEWWAGGVETPFGGTKESGYGRVKGVEAIYCYSQVKSVTIKL